MSAHYQRLPTEDHISIDFSSPFSYDSQSNSQERKSLAKQYKSAFTYGGGTTGMTLNDARYEVIKQTLLNRICQTLLSGLCFLFVILTFPVSGWFCLKMISNYERVVRFRLGRFIGLSGPGMIFVMPCIDKYQKVDLRIKAFNVPPQQLITLDRAVIEVGADIHYQIVDAKKSVMCIQDINRSMRVLVQASVVNHLVQKSLEEVEAGKYQLVAAIQEDSNRTCKSWGIEISRVELSAIKVHNGPQQRSGGPPNIMLPPGLPNTFQQLTSALMQAAASVNTNPAQGAQGQERIEIFNAFPTEQGAAGGEDVHIQQGPTPREVIAIAKGILNESLVRSVGYTYLFKVKGEGGGVFYLDLKNGSGNAGEGMLPGGDPDVTLTLSVRDMQLMFSDELQPMQAYMSGRLKTSGDLSAALQLEEVVNKVVQKLKGIQVV